MNIKEFCPTVDDWNDLLRKCIKGNSLANYESYGVDWNWEHNTLIVDDFPSGAKVEWYPGYTVTIIEKNSPCRVTSSELSDCELCEILGCECLERKCQTRRFICDDIPRWLGFCDPRDDEFVARCNDNHLGRFEAKKDAYKAIVSFLVSEIPKSRADLLRNVKQESMYLSSYQLAHCLRDQLSTEGIGEYKFDVDNV